MMQLLKSQYSEYDLELMIIVGYYVNLDDSDGLSLIMYDL